MASVSAECAGLASEPPCASQGMPIRSAPVYESPGDFGIIAAYFNFDGYLSKWSNYLIFESSILRAGLPFIVAECVFGDQAFKMPDAPHVIKLRAKDCMFQKERLLQIALRHLPREVTKVAWLDADVLFERADWAIATSNLLDEVPVAQPFYSAFRTRPFQTEFEGIGGKFRSFASLHCVLPSVSRVSTFALHGHTGFAWAARREILESLGFYDAAVMGSADDLMAHGFCGDFNSPCLPSKFLGNTAFLRHFSQWAESAWEIVRGRVGCVPGALLHLWHGEQRNRGYPHRFAAPARLGFDPLIDLRVEANGLWRWAGDEDRARQFRALSRQLFANRQEDRT
jgi:hypothetical protein